MKYQSGRDLGFDVSPVLVGRVGWFENACRRARRSEEQGQRFAALWMAAPVGLMFLRFLLPMDDRPAAVPGSTLTGLDPSPEHANEVIAPEASHRLARERGRAGEVGGSESDPDPRA